MKKKLAIGAAVAALVAPLLLWTHAASADTTTCNGQGTITVAGGEYIVQANEWNSSATQCVTATTGTAWSVSTANFNLTTNGAPATYPSIFKGCHWGLCTSGSGLPIQISKLGSATSSWSTVQPGSGAYDVAYDIWINSTPTTNGQPDGTEIMIWINSRGGVQPFGSKTGTSTASGHTWDVWTGQQTSWKIISYVLTPGATSVSNLDVKALINDATSRGSVNPNHYLLDAEAGFEIWQGGQGLATSSFSFSASTGSTGDTQPPSTPTGVTVGTTTSSSVALSWQPSTDNTAVTGYDVFRGGTLVGSPSGTSFTDSGLSPSTQYSYTVVAKDAAGNRSPASAAVSATTQPGGSTGGSGCSASYHLDNQWSTGFTSTITVTNTGTAPTAGWRVAWTWAGNQQVTNMWSATGTRNGAAETASNVDYNRVVAPGASTSFGFQATYSGTNATPTLTCTAS